MVLEYLMEDHVAKIIEYFLDSPEEEVTYQGVAENTNIPLLSIPYYIEKIRKTGLLVIKYGEASEEKYSLNQKHFITPSLRRFKNNLRDQLQEEGELDGKEI